MEKVIAKTEFHKTYLLFERKDNKTVTVRWQVFVGTKNNKKEYDVEYRYNLGTMDFNHTVSDAHIKLYSTSFTGSMDCYEAVARVCSKLSRSRDKVERDFLKKFSNKYLKAKVS